MNIEKNKLIIISSPSGAGKTTLCKLLLKKMKNVTLSISYTSREKRLQEVNGKDYFFVSRNTFEKKKQNNEITSYRNAKIQEQEKIKTIVKGKQRGKLGMDQINENIRYIAEGENEIVRVPSPWLTMTLQARLAWGASTNCLRPELN